MCLYPLRYSDKFQELRNEKRILALKDPTVDENDIRFPLERRQLYTPKSTVSQGSLDLIVEMWTDDNLIYGTRPVLDLKKPNAIMVGHGVSVMNGYLTRTHTTPGVVHLGGVGLVIDS